MADGRVPAAADAQVVPFGHEVHHARVGGQAADDVGGAVGRVVVDDNDVESEVRLLRECAAHGVGYGAYAVAHGYDDGGFDGEIPGVELRLVELVGSQPRADGLEVVRTHAFHLQLHVALARVDVVELLLAAGARVGQGFGVQRLVEVEQFAPPAQEQAEGVARGKAQAAGPFLLEKGGQCRRAQQHEAAEVEVVAQAAGLVVRDGVETPPVGAGVVAVGVDHEGARVVGRLDEALQTAVAQPQRGRAQVEQGVGARGAAAHLPEQARAAQPVADERTASFGQAARGRPCGANHVYMAHQRVGRYGGEQGGLVGTSVQGVDKIDACFHPNRHNDTQRYEVFRSTQRRAPRFARPGPDYKCCPRFSCRSDRNFYRSTCFSCRSTCKKRS